jgi:multidrug efflux system outer membrane protein
MRPNRFSIVALLAFLAGGCANLPSVGPDYHAPETKAPTRWSEPLAGGETNSAAATAAWWKNFHDAELDSLIERAASSNLDLRIAQSRVREARAHYRMTSADFWPTIDGSGSYARQRESQNQPLVGPGDHLPSGIPFENNF